MAWSSGITEGVCVCCRVGTTGRRRYVSDFGSTVCFCVACKHTRHLCIPCIRVLCGRMPNNSRNHSRRANTESSGERPTTRGITLDALIPSRRENAQRLAESLTHRVTNPRRAASCTILRLINECFRTLDCLAESSGAARQLGWARERVRRVVGLSPTTKGYVCFQQRPNRPTRTIPGSLGKRPTTAESPNPHYTRVVGETPKNGRIAQHALYPGRWGNAQQRPNRPTRTQSVCGLCVCCFAFGACPSSCSLQYLRLVLSWFYGCAIHRVRGQSVSEWVCFLVLSCLAKCGEYKTKFNSNLDLLFASTAIAVTREYSRTVQ